MKYVGFLTLLILFFTGVVPADERIDEEKRPVADIYENIQYPRGRIDPNLAAIAYAGDESFRYDVFWSGVIKIGEMILEIKRAGPCGDCYEIDSLISTSGGLIHRLYPIEDRHKTVVRGGDRLPSSCEIKQKQGKNYRAEKSVRYDQERFVVVREKRGEAAETYQLDGVVHNEFSSFFASRVMDLQVGVPFVVPTFGDDQRHEVVVETQERAIVDKSILGSVVALKVTPVLKFSGLYDKKGDTTIWYTDDECRVPVRIQSKIVIGSLTATLAEYHNPLCQQYVDSVIQQ